ncbi:UDP-N-acetylglucosamine 2-epimerase (hydrolyzing) [Oceanidesulfovibrio indonesiensis]|uniref:UDP-N-acetylglucosamine 2-epimerase (Hydrolyzing) n=1 Tax=Oceanidesulfovibrio indonesiensis TaxID=54767 RepID=A0A7M3MAE3_9BACT|nr:UDP-N-acetylglucosamine 2-epimerase [Oceanidesulfovibrio indonesiensis]TVM13815.1 UDP-N-acetylglucosamine 2-epimerase (hydrolyzing) [Oceanidesulfovibrio indonesiensis]
MNKRKVCIIVASRANYGRIKSVLHAVNEHPGLELQLVVEASALLYRYGSIIENIQRDGFTVDATAYTIVEGENPTTMAKSTGLAIIELTSVFERLKPDVVLTVADRFETLATAVAASYMNIPLAHTQGGELTGSIDESVRHAITKLSHVHFPSNDRAAAILSAMGEEPWRIFVTGCPAIDLAAQAITCDPGDLFVKYGGTGQPLSWDEPFLVVLQHPVTTEYGNSGKQIEQTLEAVSNIAMQTAWFWPNVDAGSDDISKRLRMFRERNTLFPLHFYRNFSPEDYACLLNKAACLVGNSSSGIREGAYLGTPVVNIGSRQRSRQRGGNVIDAGYDAQAIEAGIRSQLANGRYPSDHLYGDGKAAPRIADALATVELNITKQFIHGQ